MLRHDAATARGRDDLKFASPSVAAPTGTGRAVCGGRVFRARPLCTSQAHALRTVRTRRRSDGHTSSAHVLRTYRTTRTPHVLRSVRHCPHILAHVHRLAAARTSPPHGATRGVPGRGTPTFRDLSTRPCLECHFSSKSPLSLNTRLNASSNRLQKANLNRVSVIMCAIVWCGFRVQLQGKFRAFRPCCRAAYRKGKSRDQSGLVWWRPGIHDPSQ